MIDPTLSISREDFTNFLKFIKACSEDGLNISEQVRAHPVFEHLTRNSLNALAVEISYDLQSGSYVQITQENPETQEIWTRQLTGFLSDVLPSDGSLLEVGVGEATTLAPISRHLALSKENVFGFDISWSRLQVAKRWMASQETFGNFFVADMMRIPLESDSIDVVYSSHSLEPNRGNEVAMIAECLRVSRKAVVLFEPLYELADDKARQRMDKHGYVTGLVEAAKMAGGIVTSHRLLEFSKNPLNPSGVIVIQKSERHSALAPHKGQTGVRFACPLTGSLLEERNDNLFSTEFGILYPKAGGVPLLRSQYAVLASFLLGDLQ